jgi:hypothetical protein
MHLSISRVLFQVTIKVCIIKLLSIIFNLLLFPFYLKLKTSTVAKHFFLLSDVYIDVPDIIDISHMRSKGRQDGEELLPDGGM